METPQTIKRYSGIRKTLGDELFQKIQNAKVLVVGAGGIGCELLKNLVMGGFADIEVLSIWRSRVAIPSRLATGAQVDADAEGADTDGEWSDD